MRRRSLDIENTNKYGNSGNSGNSSQNQSLIPVGASTTQKKYVIVKYDYLENGKQQLSIRSGEKLEFLQKHALIMK